MIEDGLVDEVKKLIKRYGTKQKAFDAIGYREIIEYLNGKITLAEAIDMINKNTWHYARRQMTWFKRNQNIHWIADNKKTKLMQIIKNFCVNKSKSVLI